MDFKSGLKLTTKPPMQSSVWFTDLTVSLEVNQTGKGQLIHSYCVTRSVINRDEVSNVLLMRRQLTVVRHLVSSQLIGIRPLLWLPTVQERFRDNWWGITSWCWEGKCQPFAYENLNMNEHGLWTSGLFPWSTKLSREKKCQAFRTFWIQDRVPIYFQQVGAVWQWGLIFLYNALKFPYKSKTHSVLEGSSIKKEELECPDGRAIYSWLEVQSFSCENIVTVIGSKNDLLYEKFAW